MWEACQVGIPTNLFKSQLFLSDIVWNIDLVPGKGDPVLTRLVFLTRKCHVSEAPDSFSGSFAPCYHARETKAGYPSGGEGQGLDRTLLADTVFGRCYLARRRVSSSDLSGSQYCRSRSRSSCSSSFRAWGKGKNICFPPLP